MTTNALGIVGVWGTLICLVAWGAEAPETVEPSFGKLQETVIAEMAKAREAFFDGPGSSSRVVFHQVLRCDDLLPRESKEQTPNVVWLVVAEETANAQPSVSEPLWYVMALRARRDSYESLLTYCGGFDTHVEVEVVDLESYVEFPSSPGYTNTAFPFRDVLVRDFSSPNGTSMETVLLFHFDDKLGYFQNVFAEELENRGQFEKPYEAYQGKLEIVDSDHTRMRDLRVTTDWWLKDWEPMGWSSETERNAALKEGYLDRKVVVISWNGTRYERKDDSAGGPKPGVPQHKRWLPEMASAKKAKTGAP